MSYISYKQEDINIMTDKDLIKNILGEASIVSNNSSKYIDEYMTNLYMLLNEKNKRKIIHTPEKYNEPIAGSAGHS